MSSEFFPCHSYQKYIANSFIRKPAIIKYYHIITKYYHSMLIIESYNVFICDTDSKNTIPDYETENLVYSSTSFDFEILAIKNSRRTHFTL